MDRSHTQEDLACRRAAQRAFVGLARTALSEKEYDKGLRLMAAGAVLSGDPSFALDAEAGEPHRFALWRCALAAVQQTPLVVLQGRAGVRSLTFTADSTRVVAACYRGVRVWDVETGAEVAVFPLEGDIRCAVLSPDGTKVITGYPNGNAQVWEAHTRKKIVELKSDGPGPAYSVAFTADGTCMLMGAPTGIGMWDTDTGSLIRVWTHEVGWYAGVAFSQDGTRALSGFHNNKTAQVFDLTSGKMIAELEGHEQAVYHLAFGGGSRVITGSHDQTARVWDLATGKQIAIFRGQVEHVALSPDGTRALTGSRQTAHLWDVYSGEEIRVWQAPRGVSAFAFYADNNRAMVGSYGGASVWDAHWGEDVAILRGHGERIVKVAFSPDGTRAITGSVDATARIWDLATGSKIAVLHGHTGPVIDVAFTPDGRRALTGSGSDARLWDAQTGKELAVVRGWEEPLEGVVFSPDGTRMVTWTKDKTARLWDAATGSEITVLRGHEGAVWCAAFSPDGSRLVTGAFDRTTRVWDLSSGAELLKLRDPEGGQGGALASAAFSLDGKRLLTSYVAWFPLPRPEFGGGSARIWDLASGREIAVLNHESAVGEVPKHSTKLRDISIQRSGHPGVFSVAFSPDGARAITGADDRTARLWDVAAGAEIAALRGHEGSLLSVAFSPDGTRAITGSDDHTARVWDVSRWSAFNGDRAVYLAAALDCGLGLRSESEREDLLMQCAPDDLFAAMMERLSPEQRASVPEVSRRLRMPLDPNCYRRHCTR